MFLKRLTDKKSAGGCEDEQMQQIEQIDELEHEKKNRLKISAVITKKNIVVLASLILIGGAVGLNWVLFSGDTSAGNSVSSGTYYQSNSMLKNNTEGEMLGDASFVDASESSQDTDSYFASTQISRQRARDEAIEVLQLVAENGEAVQDVKDQALAEITAIAAEIEKEANIETIITSKGFEQCIAVINDDMVSIIVKTSGGGLLQNEITQIKEVVCEQTGISPTNIKIVERSGV